MDKVYVCRNKSNTDDEFNVYAIVVTENEHSVILNRYLKHGKLPCSSIEMMKPLFKEYYEEATPEEVSSQYLSFNI